MTTESITAMVTSPKQHRTQKIAMALIQHQYATIPKNFTGTNVDDPLALEAGGNWINSGKNTAINIKNMPNNIFQRTNTENSIAWRDNGKASPKGISTHELINAGGGLQLFIDVVNLSKKGEVVNWHINDESVGLDLAYIQYMNETVEKLDKIIDLDFTLTSDIRDSVIDVNLYDYSDQDYMGLAIYNNYWTELDIVNFSSLGGSSDDNKNTFIHELGHALGLGEPGFDDRWDQDDTAMSYNEGDVGWRTWYTASDLNALIKLWGAEDDHMQFPASNISYGSNQYTTIKGDLGDDKLSGSRGRDHLIGSEGNDILRAGGGRDIISGGMGADILFGGFGLNTFLSEIDGEKDLLCLKSDHHAYDYIYDDSGSNSRNRKCDNIMGLDSFDVIFIQGVSDEDLSFAWTTHQSILGTFEGIGIWAGESLEAVYTGGNLAIDQVIDMTWGAPA